jgi:Co/Zn/Cd efflux system component
MTNNSILSLIFLVVIFFGVYKDNSENSLQDATIMVEQNILHLAGAEQHNPASAWSLFQSLKHVKVHIIHPTEKSKHECLSGTCIHQTTNGFSIRYCCVKRLLSIVYTVFFLLVLYKFSDPIPTTYKNVQFFKGYGDFA